MRPRHENASDPRWLRRAARQFGSLAGVGGPWNDALAVSDRIEGSKVVSRVGGVVMDAWQVNAAVVRRMGSATVGEDEHVGCRFCGFAGEYSIGMTGLYLDASADFEL
jgi:hypothetical protein